MRVAVSSQAAKLMETACRCHNDSPQASFRVLTEARLQRKKAQAASFETLCRVKSCQAETCIFSSFSPAMP